MRNLRIHVLKRDIQNGKRCNTSCCPIALAVRRQTHSGGWAVQVGFGDVDVKGRIYQFPAAAASFISSFDRGRPVKPITFTALRSLDA